MTERAGGWIVRGYAQWVTERAVLIDVEGTGDQRWVPLSQVRRVLEGSIDAAAVNRVRHAEDLRGRTPCFGGGGYHAGYGADRDDLGVENHHECPVTLAVNPWFVNLEGLPHERPGRRCRDAR